jgi:TonB-linked SusC/RagA family outer membrane protein
MKLTIFMMAITLVHATASVYSQTARLTLTGKNIPLAEVFKQIEEQSEFSFFYNVRQVDLDKRVDVNFENQLVEKILHEVLSETNLTFSVNNRLIVIHQKDLAEKNLSELQQPQNMVGGKVADERGNPLPGVTVVVKGKALGTVTDANGNYSLSNVQPDAVLVFSFVGMKTQEIMPNGKTTINVQMVEEMLGIEEVVAIGYGTIKKKDLTGSVASVDGATIANRQTTQLSQSLQGTMPGVTVTRSSSEPGSDATIRVRGITTLSDSNPLVIVDGVPGNLNDVNPDDVQDISVLKDASSASIYGARAAAGVILITTKRAKAGQVNMEYTFNYGIETITSFPEVVGARRYLEMMNELLWNDAGNTPGGDYALYSKDQVENWLIWNKDNPNRYPVTDWVDLLVNSFAPKQDHQVSFNYGNEKIQSRASIVYENVGALYDHKNYQRVSTRFNNHIELNDYLSANVDFAFNTSLMKSPIIDPINDAWTTAPIYAALWTDGRIAEGKSGSNPYARLHYGGFSDSRNNRIAGKISLDFKPMKGMTLSAVVSPLLNFGEGKKFTKQLPFYDADDPTLFRSYIAGHDITKLEESRPKSKSLTKQFLANYAKTIGGDHQLNLMGGYEDYSAYSELLNASRTNYILSNFPYLNQGPLDYQYNSGSASETAYRSFFGRAIYQYSNKYMLQANFRYDGSSRFHPDYRWASFPSFSAGWVVTEESFLKKNPAISFLKLRGSWGTLGNERIGDYPYQATIEFSNALFYQGKNLVSSMTAAQRQYAIQNITWETTETWDIGIDANFFNNRLMFSGDYYVKNTKDMLLALEIPDFMGVDNPDQNTGKMKTKGWDISLSWKDKIDKLSYFVSFNLSDYQSVLGDLGGIVFVGEKIIREGSEYNEWYGYKSDGLFQTAEEVANSPKLSNAVKPGDIKYLDLSGPDGVPDGKISPDYDRTLHGGSLPRFIFGSTINLEYNGFDLSMVLQGVGKQNSRFSPDMIQPFVSTWTNVQKIIDDSYWSVYNTEDQNLKAKYPRLATQAATNNYAMSDFWLFNGQYLRLKLLTVGYTLPQKFVKSIKMKGVRVYGSATDLFSFDHYPKGWDPEVSSTSYISKSFNIGLAVKF